MDFALKLGFLVLIFTVVISLKNQNREPNRNASFDESLLDLQSFIVNSAPIMKLREDRPVPEPLRYDYYRESCPMAEEIIRSTVQELYKLQPNVAPALLRLFFHDCFVEGCDGSVLLDPADGIESEKDSPPNESLRGFDQIDIIKSDLESACPGVVSCADILALAARESVLLVGGPFYPLLTGRKDSTISFLDIATYDLPSPQDNLSKVIHSFGRRGFSERETVSLLGAHSTGTIHCKFFTNRLYNFNGSTEPDPSIDTKFLDLLRANCNSTQSSPSPTPSPSPSPSPAPSDISLSTGIFEDPGMKLDYEGPGTGFGTLYYQSLLQGKGLLFADQQLTTGEETATWVRTYAYDTSQFREDFGNAMVKLSNFRVLTAPMGQVRFNCRKVN